MLSSLVFILGETNEIRGLKTFTNSVYSTEYSTVYSTVTIFVKSNNWFKGLNGFNVVNFSVWLKFRVVSFQIFSK